MGVRGKYNRVRRGVGAAGAMAGEAIDGQMTADSMRVVRVGRQAIPARAKGGGGAVINISSINSDGLKGRALRSASKAALNSLTIAMALDHGPQHIRVNALVLGPVGASGGRGGEGGVDPSRIGRVAPRGETHDPIVAGGGSAARILPRTRTCVESVDETVLCEIRMQGDSQ